MSQYLEALKAPKDQILLPMSAELMRSLPDSIFLGTGLLALLTQSYPIATLLLTMLELGVFQNMLGSLTTLFTGGTRETTKIECLSGLPNVNSIGLLKLLLREPAFPSGPILFISGVLSYTMASILNFKRELEALGNKDPEWKSRIPMSMIFGVLFLMTFAIWRYYTGCEGVLSVLGSILIGILLGILLSIVHTYLFGRDSINFLGVPLLSDRASEGRPLYVCASQT